jgi:hypothetical protein
VKLLERLEHDQLSFQPLSQLIARALARHRVSRSVGATATALTTGGAHRFARLDERDYPPKVQVSDDELAAVNLTTDPFHPEWNYAISPSPDPAG